MKEQLRALRDISPGLIAAGAVAGLIGWDILRAPNSGEEVTLGVRSEVPGGTTPREVRDYVEFTVVADGPLEVVTGIRFESSLNGRITRQWCYVEKSGDLAGHTELKLTLALKPDGVKLVPLNLTTESLAAFKLSAQTARQLVSSHCRFR